MLGFGFKIAIHLSCLLTLVILFAFLSSTTCSLDCPMLIVIFSSLIQLHTTWLLHPFSTPSTAHFLFFSLHFGFQIAIHLLCLLTLVILFTFLSSTSCSLCCPMSIAIFSSLIQLHTTWLPHPFSTPSTALFYFFMLAFGIKIAIILSCLLLLVILFTFLSSTSCSLRCPVLITIFSSHS